MIRSLTLAVITSLALCSLADERAGSRPGAPTPNWSEPAETGVAWDSGAFAYDDSGNIVRIGLDGFSYDGVNRLTAGAVHAHGVSTLQTFEYDRYGNLLEISTTLQAGDFPSAPETATLIVNPATNRLGNACKSTVCETWSYDDSTGQVTRTRRTGGTAPYDVHLAWDPSGSMTELTGEVAHERYVYDANDERVLMVSLDGDREVIRRWTWRDASNKVAREVVEQVGINTWTDARDYVYRGGRLLASFTSAAATVAERHYHVDHLGTPRLITDSERHKVAIDAYLPFGGRAAGGEFPYVGYSERLRFTGHERDAEGSPHRPSLDYMHARHYAMEWGRFVSVDPAGIDLVHPQSWNRYSYVLNNPVNMTDPTGACGEGANFIGPPAPCHITMAPPPNAADWTPEQRALENQMNSDWAEAAANGGTRVTPDNKRTPGLRKKYEAEHGPIGAGKDLGHRRAKIIDGTDEFSNLEPQDKKANRSHGTRQGRALRGHAGHVVGRVSYTVLAWAPYVSMLVNYVPYAQEFEARNGYAPSVNETLNFFATGERRSFREIEIDNLTLKEYF